MPSDLSGIAVAVWDDIRDEMLALHIELNDGRDGAKSLRQSSDRNKYRQDRVHISTVAAELAGCS